MLRNHAKGYCMTKLPLFYPPWRLLVLLLRKTQTDCVQWLLQSDEMPTAKSPGPCNCFDPQNKRSITCNLLPQVHHARHKELPCLYKATTTCLKRSQSSNKVKKKQLQETCIISCLWCLLLYFALLLAETKCWNCGKLGHLIT